MIACKGFKKKYQQSRFSSILFVPIRYYRQKVRPAPWTLEVCTLFLESNSTIFLKRIFCFLVNIFLIKKGSSKERRNKFRSEALSAALLPRLWRSAEADSGNGGARAGTRNQTAVLYEEEDDVKMFCDSI